MAMRSGFFESDIVGYDAENLPILDRAEDAEFHAEYFKSFIGNGIFPNPSDNFMVQAEEGMRVKVRPGRCFIQGFFAFDYEEQTIEIEEADAAMNRIDRVVLRLDLPQRVIVLAVKKGTPAESPQPPVLARPEDSGNADLYELGLADVLVSKITPKITQDKITDLRLSTELCGIVHGVVDQVDTQSLFLQYERYLNQQMSGWNQTKTQQQAAWNAQMQQQARDWTKQMQTQQSQQSEIEQWYDSVQNDITKLQTFDFDNLAALKGVTKTSQQNADGSWIEEIRVTKTNLRVAVRQTVRQAETWVAVVTVYDSNGTDVLKDATIRSTRDTDGSWTEVVSGSFEGTTPSLENGVRISPNMQLRFLDGGES